MLPRFEEEDFEDDETEINFDDIIKCEESEIENLKFMKSSKKLISSIENMISQIDDKLRLKRPAGVYFNPYG